MWFVCHQFPVCLCEKNELNMNAKIEKEACEVMRALPGTPFPPQLCALIKDHVACHVSKRRFEPYCLPCA